MSIFGGDVEEIGALEVDYFHSHFIGRLVTSQQN